MRFGFGFHLRQQPEKILANCFQEGLQNCTMRMPSNRIFHQSIREVLSPLDLAPYQLLWGPDCGGTRQNQLFRDGRRCAEGRYAYPDCMLADSARSVIPLILEIEEESSGECGFQPTRLGGKLLSAALSRFASAGEEWMPLAPALAFIQVLNNASLPRLTRKLLQYDHYERDVRRLLPLGPVAQYWLFAGTREEFLVGEKGGQLRKAVAGVVAQCRNHLACQNEPPGRIVELITRPGG